MIDPKVPKEAKEVFAVISHTNKTKADGIIGHIWWDGKVIGCTIPSLYTSLKSSTIGGYHFNDGYEFFQKIPLHVRGGYTSVKKIK